MGVLHPLVPPMPSRPVVALIVLFWLAVLGVVVYRDVLPRYFGDAPPAVAFGPEDELSSPPVEWTIHRGPAKQVTDEQIGRMTSSTKYLPDENTFRYENRYRGVKLKQPLVDLTIPSATTTIRLDPAGRLKGQKVVGTAEVESRTLLGAGQKLTATVDAEGVVKDGFLVGSAKLTCPELLSEPSVGEFTPVAVREGQVLNPLMPLDRLRDVVPGRRWVVQQVDPLRDALGKLLLDGLQEEWAKVGGGKRKPVAVKLPEPLEFTAHVLPDPVALDRPSGPASCWVIEYTTAKDPNTHARTYVRRDDGRVLRQEAISQGERLRFERAD